MARRHDRGRRGRVEANTETEVAVAGHETMERAVVVLACNGWHHKFEV